MSRPATTVPLRTVAIRPPPAARGASPAPLSPAAGERSGMSRALAFRSSAMPCATTTRKITTGRNCGSGVEATIRNAYEAASIAANRPSFREAAIANPRSAAAANG